MKATKQKKNVFIIILYIILVATVPFTMLLSHKIKNNLNAHIQHTIQSSADLCAEMIERQYENDMLQLDSLAMRMSLTLEEDPQRGIDRMVSTAQRYGMKRIAFSTPDGHTISTDGAVMDLSKVSNFEKAMAGKAHLTSVIKDEADGEDINIYSMPVYHTGNQEILGVLSAVYDSDMFRDMLSVDTFDGEGYTCIINSEGDVVIDSNHPNAIQSMENLFDYMTEQQQSEEDITEIINNISKKQQGFIQVRSDKGNRYACYVPLQINDWYLLSIVPKDMAEVTKESVMRNMSIYFIGISLIAVYAVLSIRHSQKEKNQLLEKALYEEPLTGGRTQEKFKLDCQKWFQYQLEVKAACGFLVIENFNLVATLYGNKESDAAICHIFEIIQKCIGDRGIVCKSGSNQFYVMYFYEDMEELEANIKQFHMMLHDSVLFDNMLRPSLGLYVMENREESIDDMMSKARIAQETIKQNNNNNNIAYYDESFRNALYEDKHMEDEMMFALTRHEFVPYLQPKYDAETGAICGAEALIRWITEDGTIIPPGKFIPLAENNGFVRMLDREMFSMVCQLQKDLLNQGITPVPISVNMSRPLMYDRNFVDDYFKLMQEMELPTCLVELEITETVLFEDIEFFRTTLEKLRGHGFRILMDDFGTGYSSLMMLKSVPIDEIKLDKSFVDDYRDKKGRYIIRCVLELASRLELPVVAEGVETEHQYLYLKKMGCNVIQGYYFSKPLAPAEYTEKLKQRSEESL